MQKYFLMLLATVGFAASASQQATVADMAAAFGMPSDSTPANPAPTGTPPAPPAACTAIALTDAEKATIQAAFQQHKIDLVTLQANLKLAHLNYVSLVMGTTAAATDASAQDQKIVDAVTALATNDRALVTNLMFTVLTTAQRNSAYQCMQALRHQHGG